MISSYLEQDNPYTMMSLWYIFNSLEENLGRGDWAARIPHRLIGAVGDIKLAKYRFGLLRDFWLSKCTPGCSLKGDFDGKITRAKEMFASEKKKMEETPSRKEC